MRWSEKSSAVANESWNRKFTVGKYWCSEIEKKNLKVILVGNFLLARVSRLFEQIELPDIKRDLSSEAVKRLCADGSETDETLRKYSKRKFLEHLHILIPSDSVNREILNFEEKKMERP